MIEPRLASDLRELLDHTPAPVWSAFRDQRLFLTGFVGKWLLHALLHANSELGLRLHVTVLSRDPDSFVARHPGFAPSVALEYVRADVASFQPSEGRYDGLVHAALPVAPPGAGDAGLLPLAESGALQVCRFASRVGVRRVLHISSGAVYGNQSGSDCIAEDARWSDTGDVNAYTRAKRRAEQIMESPWPFELVVARLFGFLGPYMGSGSGTAATEFVHAAATGQDIVIRGTGKARRSYQYASEMARWLLVLYAHAKPGTAINVGGSQPIDIMGLARLVAGSVAPVVAVRVDGGSHAGLASGSYVPCISRAAKELGLVNNVTLAEAINRTLQWKSETG